jgi:hypothetical protein
MVSRSILNDRLASEFVVRIASMAADPFDLDAACPRHGIELKPKAKVRPSSSARMRT